MIILFLKCKILFICFRANDLDVPAVLKPLGVHQSSDYADLQRKLTCCKFFRMEALQAGRFCSPLREAKLSGSHWLSSHLVSHPTRQHKFIPPRIDKKINKHLQILDSLTPQHLKHSQYGFPGVKAWSLLITFYNFNKYYNSIIYPVNLHQVTRLFIYCVKEINTIYSSI